MTRRVSLSHVSLSHNVIGVLIDFESIVHVLLKFQYICTKEDRNELRVWLFNRNLFVQAPKFYDQNVIFISLDLFLKTLLKET